MGGKHSQIRGIINIKLRQK